MIARSAARLERVIVDAAGLASSLAAAVEFIRDALTEHLGGEEEGGLECFQDGLARADAPMGSKRRARRDCEAFEGGLPRVSHNQLMGCKQFCASKQNCERNRCL